MTEPTAPSRGPAVDLSRAVKIALIFGTSALVLTLQLLHARMLAVQFWHHLVYFVITMGFLGFAASGTYLSVSRRVLWLGDRRFYAVCLGGLGLGILVSRLVLAALPTVRFGFLEHGSLAPITAAYTALMAPYFFAGLLIGGALRREPAAAGTLYLSSLAGSAAGCLGFVALITPLGAPGLLAALFVAAAVPTLWLWPLPAARRAAGLCGIAVPTPVLAMLPVQPDRGKQYWQYAEQPAEFSEWNPISRIDVLTPSRTPWMKYIVIDGDAQAPMFLSVPGDTGVPRVPLDTPHRQALYALTEPGALERVLVIGSGGGADVLAAKRGGARHVDAVEINPTTARIVRRQFGPFTGHLFTHDGVTLYNEDGRSFAARTENRYDAVVLFAVDSLAASSTGAYVLMENYLYTFEAFTRYWQLLTERGVLQISRWYYPGADRESFRVFTMAFEVLAAQGIREPGRHIAVIGDVREMAAPFANVIVSKRPLGEAQADALVRFARTNTLGIVYLHPALTPGTVAASNEYHRFAEAYAAGRSREFYASYRFKVVPVTDDDPFFFSSRRWSDVVPRQPLPSVEYYDNMVGAKPLILLVVLVLQATALVLFLVVWPVFRSRDREPVTRTDGLMLGFFALIGIGFMFVEIPLVQRFVLLTGHPTYSMSVSLPAILLGAAAGSYLSGRGRLAVGRRVAIAVAGIVLGIVALNLGHEGLARGVLAWPLAGRLAAVAVIAGAFGVFMGIPFPTAVAALVRRPQVVSLGWTVNGGTTVIASVLAIPVAMSWGFSLVLALAAVCYLGAWLAIALWEAKEPT